MSGPWSRALEVGVPCDSHTFAMSASAPSRSLFILALPRTLSTVVHAHACVALGFRQPLWTTAGEILNGDRLVASGRGRREPSPKFTLPEESYAFGQWTELLDDAAVRTGRVYKDVVQPFVVSRWLPGKGLAVLRLRRPIADVALSMQSHGWWYPERAAERAGGEDGDRLDRLLRGLLRASEALATVSAVVVEFEDLLRDPEALRSALADLYPGLGIPPLEYLDDEFRRHSRRVVEARREPLWLDLQRRLETLTDREP
jgi:hypothetical protein